MIWCFLGSPGTFIGVLKCRDAQYQILTVLQLIMSDAAANVSMLRGLNSLCDIQLYW